MGIVAVTVVVANAIAAKLWKNSFLIGDSLKVRIYNLADKSIEYPCETVSLLINKTKIGNLSAWKTYYCHYF